mgnify:CR=1 FL=1
MIYDEGIGDTNFDPLGIILVMTGKAVLVAYTLECKTDGIDSGISKIGPNVPSITRSNFSLDSCGTEYQNFGAPKWM